MKQYRYQDFINQLATGSLYGVFIDDTGSPGLSSTPKHLHPERKTWVGVVIPPNQMPEVLEQFQYAIDELNNTLGATEFHFTDIYSGKKQFKNIDLKVRLGLFGFMAEIFNCYNFPIFVQTLNPETLKKFQIEYELPSKLGDFNLTKQEDAALFILLLKIQSYLAKENGHARVFIDEGFKKNGIALKLDIPIFNLFLDELICFANSSSIYPIQLADFAAFGLNRTQMLLGKEELSELDKSLLNILSSIAWNYQNIDVRNINGWSQRFDNNS